MSAIKHFSSNAQSAFETYASMNRHVFIDPKTGEGILRIPIAGLFADAGTSPAINLGFSCKAYTGDLNIIRCGYAHVNERGEPADFRDLPLSDGRTLTFNIEGEEGFHGGDFLVKTLGASVAVYHKNGTCEIFGMTEKLAHASLCWIYPIRYVLPSGRSLFFEWETLNLGPRIIAVNDDHGRLLDVEWRQPSTKSIGNSDSEPPVLKKATLFPNSSHEVVFTCKHEYPVGPLAIEVSGAVGSGTTIYLLEKRKQDQKIGKFEIRRLQSIAADKPGDPDIVETSTHTESMDFDGNRIVKHTTSPGGGITELVESYKFETNKTTVDCTQGDKNVLSRVYSFQGDAKASEAVTASNVTVLTEQSVSIDKTRGVATHKTTKKIDDKVVDELTLEYDAAGNLIKSTQGDSITEWTYFNNYNAYTVSEKKTTYQDTSFFGLLLKPFEYLNPIGLGFAAFGSGGLTWGTKVETTVSMSITDNNYAKVAFQLPFDMNYPGDPQGFTSHIESEIVYRKDGDKQTAQRLTYYGYRKFTPKEIEDVSRPHVLLPHRKLTVMQPSYEEVDVSAEQLKVAKAAAKALLDSLDKQRDSTKNKEEKAEVQTVIDNLNKSLVAQSKANARGFKLKKTGDKWAEGSMHLEEIDYQTSAGNPGFGQVSSTRAWLIDASGNKVNGSEIKTTFEYKFSDDDKRKIDSRITTKTADGMELRSGQTHSALTGRIYETTDTENVRTTYAYEKKTGLMAKAKATLDDVTLWQRNYSITPIKNNRLRYDTHESPSGQRARVVKDELSRDRQVLLSPDGKTWLQMCKSNYDAQGRLASTEEFDYDHTNAKYSTLTTTWTYDDDKNICTVQKVLKNASDKEVDTKTLVLTSKAMSETMLVGTAETVSSYDPAKRTLTETSGPAGAPEFRSRSTFDTGGNLTSVNIETIDSKRNPIPGDKTSFTYDAYGRLKTLTPKIGGATSFTYDRFDRLITSSTDGVEIGNTYSAASLANVATAGHIKDTAGKISLGTQAIDGLGRPTAETINGTTTKFTYNGASRWSKRENAGKRPAALKGYKSELDSSGLIYTETVPDGTSTRTTKTVSSRRGLLLEFEDCAGTKTKFDYDAFGRLVASKNDVCECKFVYFDSGLLKQETIKAVKQNLSMTVVHTYNRSGIETKREFKCTGIKTHLIESQRMDDGRIDRIMLKIDDKVANSDHFEYDASQRLKTWHCTQAGFEIYGGKRVVKQAFTYDKLANVLSCDSESYTGTSRPEKLSTSTTKRVYDGAKPGMLKSVDGTAVTNDDLGRLTKRANRSLTYHGNGQVKTCSSTAGGKDGDYTFSYDDLGRIRGGSAGKGKWNDTYHYRGQKPYAVVQQDDAKQHGFNKRVLILKNDCPSCWVQSAETTIDGKTTTSHSFELRDSTGTVFASIDLDSKAVTYYRYSPHGYRSLNHKAVTWLGFKGEPLNYVGFYHFGNGYRLYDPEYFRFQTPDSMSPFDVGGVSAYGYCGGDPVNYHDPSGHQAVAQYSRLDTMPAIYSQEFRIAASVLGVLAAPFSAGSSIAIAVAVTGISAVSGAFEIASVLLEESDPNLSRVLGYLGLGFGVASIGVGLGAAAWRAPSVVAGRGSLRGGLHSRITTRVDRANPTLAGPQRLTLNTPDGIPLHLDASPHSTRLVISSHGQPAAGFTFQGVPVPETFSTGMTRRVGFYAEPGFKVNMLGHSYDELVRGAYVPKHYYDAARRTPNYVLGPVSQAEYLKEWPSLATSSTPLMTDRFKNMAITHGVDVAQPLQHMTLEQLLNTLEAAGHRYHTVDGLFCRGTLSSTAPAFVKTSIGGILRGFDWLQGSRMIP